MWDLDSRLRELDAQNLRRRLRVIESPQGTTMREGGRELINFSSNDYLGLAGDERIKAALLEGIAKHGAGSGASRLVCGSLAPHGELEERLAAFKRTEAALTFSSGYAAALGTIPALMGSDDVIILDKLCHASLVDAARLSGATIRVFPHNHLGKLEKLLQSSQGRRTLIVTESIFSMDGDAAALRDIVELKDQHGAWLMLDEAHAVGMLGPQGRGLAAALDLDQRIELHMGTLSKAIGLSGGYLAASRTVIDVLINKARSLIYSTAPPPCIAYAAGVALDLIASSEGNDLRSRLKQNVAQLTANLKASQPLPAAIIPLIIGEEEAAMQTSTQLHDAGFLVPAIRYPTVARGTARLRITLSAAHTAEQIEMLTRELQSLGKMA